MRVIRLGLILGILALVLHASPSSAAGERLALVIGNAKYPDAESPLREPINDARALADELKRDGFTVEVGENLTGDQMRRAFDRLYGKIKPGSVALLFFSGFGLQSSRQTYMIPVDAQIWTEADARRDGFSLENVLREINSRGAGVKIALIDAARRNPFERRFRSFSAGLAPVIAPAGTLVMYSAALSSVVPNNSGDLSLFVRELLKEIRVPDLTAEETLDRTRVGVTRASRSEQVPWISSSLEERFTFNQAGNRPSPPPALSSSTVQSPPSQTGNAVIGASSVDAGTSIAPGSATAQPPGQVAAAQPPKPATESFPASSSFPSSAEFGRRVALVIGNSTYKDAPPLANPTRDASAIASTLQRLGFQSVTLETNLGREKMIDSLRSFARQAQSADWALVYFAGHGMEVGGVNYLLPTDASIESDRDMPFAAVPLEQVLNATERARKLRLVVLDACRNNPYANRMARTAEVSSRSTVTRGFARVEPNAGTLVVYAAKDGQTASDGDGSNSPFTLAMLKNLAKPGVEIRRMFDNVRDDVQEFTRQRQLPYTYGSVTGREDFYFAR